MLKPNPAVGKEFSSGSIILTASGESHGFRAILCADCLPQLLVFVLVPEPLTVSPGVRNHPETVN